jgi:4-hydroxybenzoate polyprenyltransferase
MFFKLVYYEIISICIINALKPSNLWPTLWALWIAGEAYPDILVTTVFVLGVILMRSAGCVINDYADRNIDPHVKGTRERLPQV